MNQDNIKVLFGLVLVISFSNQNQIWCKDSKLCFGNVFREGIFKQDGCLMITWLSFFDTCRTTFQNQAWWFRGETIFGFVLVIYFSNQDQIWCKDSKLCFGEVLREGLFNQDGYLMIALFPFIWYMPYKMSN